MKKWLYLLLFFLIGLVVVFLCAWYYHFFPFTKNPYLRIPVQFTISNLPYTEIEIEGAKYRVKIDLGSSSQCCLHRQLLDKISKQFYRTYQWFDIKGNIYESKAYLVPKIKIRTCQLSNLTVGEEPLEFVSDGSLIWKSSDFSSFKDSTETDGRLGWELFQGLYPFFDLKNSVFYITRGSKSLKREGYIVEKLVSVPFEMTRFGCVVVIDTDLGKRRFLLDTGASDSIIKPSAVENKETEEIINWASAKKVMTLSKFMIGSHDCGDMKMYLYELSPKFENIDGILGMDFFKKYVIFIDCDERQLWIGPSAQVMCLF